MKGVMIWSNLKVQRLFGFLHYKQTSQASSLLSVFSWGEQPDSNFCKYTWAGLWEVLRTAEEWVTLLLSLLHWGYCSCQILPFTWKTSQRSFHIPDCHPSLSPFLHPLGLQDSIFPLSCRDRPQLSEVARSLEKEGGKTNPQQNKTCSHSHPKSWILSLCAIMLLHSLLTWIFGGELPIQSVSTVGTAQFYKHKVLWLHWFPS